jgi:hypothetical protein
MQPLKIEQIDEIKEPVPPKETGASASENADYDRQVELDLKKERLAGLKQDRSERKNYADKIYTQTAYWLWSILALILLCGFGRIYGFFYLSDPVILGVIGGTTTTVIGLFIIVVKYLFPNK